MTATEKPNELATRTFDWRTPSLFATLALSIADFAPVLADDAVVLPKGVNGVRLSYTDYFTIDKRYDADGNEEDVGADFDGVSLDSTVFPALGLVEDGFGMPAGSASLGDTEVELEYDIKQLELVYARGLTDKLTVGVKIPYFWLDSNVDAVVNSGEDSSATVGLNPFFGLPFDPFGSPIAPVAVGGQPVTTENVQDLIGDGLDVNGDGTVDIPGFGFERFESWSDDGIGDVEAQGRYQYLRNDEWRHAFTGGVRFPTGEVDDPDNLVDLAFGQGAYAVLLRTNHDYTGFENWTLNVTAKYDWYLPDSETLRVPDAVDQPLTSNKEKVDRDLGDLFEIDLKAIYAYSQGGSTFVRYRYITRQENSIDGDQGFNYSSLEDETDRTDHQIIVGIAYSSLRKYQERRTGIPFAINLQYRNRFAGKNVLDSQYLKTEFSVFF